MLPPSCNGALHEIRAEVPVGDSTTKLRGTDGTLSGRISAVAVLSDASADAVLVIVTIFDSYNCDGSSWVNCAERVGVESERTTLSPDCTVTGAPNVPPRCLR